MTLTREEFAGRFGAPDTTAALSGFTPPGDTQIVLALVAALHPLRILEIGTAAGSMTANLTAWSPPDAVVFSLGVVADAAPRAGALGQAHEVPPRAEFGRHANHFGTGHKARLIVADSRGFDFTPLAPLDLVFVDGGHDQATARSDSARSYAALRPGGCLIWHDGDSPVHWVEVQAAVQSLRFPEPIYHVAGTGVAFLFKGEGVGATAAPERPRLAIAWHGEFLTRHSIPGVNRAVCAELLANGHNLTLHVPPFRTIAAAAGPLPPELAACQGVSLRTDITIRHQSPSDFTPPADSSLFVQVLPWEYGRIPRDWIEPILQTVDEVWTYSRSVERCFQVCGIPTERLAVIPLGIDPDRYRPGLCPLPLATRKTTRLLFLGGTIRRKGFDVLLAAYRRAFTAADDVCLVVKDHGVGTFYPGLTAEKRIAAVQADPRAPEIEYLDRDLTEEEIPRLYAACAALVHPYRGEGFALPVLEAMACGLPVVVTSGGPTDEFVPPSACWRLPGRVDYFPADRVGKTDTVGRPWWLEPDEGALVEILRAVVSGAGERARRGAAARRAALGWTWARTAAAVEDRARILRNRSPIRFRRTVPPVLVPSRPGSSPALPPRPRMPVPVSPDRPQVVIAWDGEFEPIHSLAGVNRAVCRELLARGHTLSLLRTPPREPAGGRVNLPPELVARVDAPLRADVTVRHRWPPDFTPPGGGGSFVLIQPWEYGRIPRAWVGPIQDQVDEVWAYTQAVKQAYVASGIPADRVALLPLGVDVDRFRPGLTPFPLTTRKRIKLLFVGGTIWRKGFDTLLTAYRKGFTADDDICLVVKDMGVGTFYRGQTAATEVAALQADPAAPAVEYLTTELPEDDLARLYAACDALILPYRGEGFGLPVLEAMACGLPVVVTSGGPTDEFVPPTAGWRIPSGVREFPQERVGNLETVGRPWCLEPEVPALVEILRAIVGDAKERLQRGAAARRAALEWSWTRTAAAIEDRVRVLRNRNPVRFRHLPSVPLSSLPVTPRGGEPLALFVVTSGLPPAVPIGRPRVSLTMIVKDEEQNLPACLGPVRGLVDEVVVVDTGSSDRTREVAAGLGARVSEFRWVDSFAAARNAALDQATGDWAFWLDADDRVDPDNVRKLTTLFAGLTWENAGYVMTCLCVPSEPGGTTTAVDHVRLFRHDLRHRWTYRVHEQIIPSLRATGATVRWSEVSVQHVGYVDAALRRRKLARDLRLLELERGEKPGDPFTLFNLGSVYHELGDMPAAIIALEASLAGSAPRDSIVRKLYSLLVQCHRRVGDRDRAFATCRAGRGIYPEDAELLFVEANLFREVGDTGSAERALWDLLNVQEAEHFGSVDTGLRGYKARHNLACLYRDQGRVAEAEVQWTTALTEEPGFVPAHLGLAEVYLSRGEEAEVHRVVEILRGLGPTAQAEAEALLGRFHIRQGDSAAARRALEAAAGRFPESVAVRVAISHAVMASGGDAAEVEAAVRAILALDPHHTQALHNLEVARQMR
jgi:glycosyltransferase involved in cell wall biosynthesis/predicted O-methyltransferase YrrM